MTTMADDDYSSSTTDANNYSDYPDADFPGFLCNKDSVREFRRSYEPPLYWIIFVLGAVGNLLVVWIYMTVRNRLKTMTDMYLLNLTVADLLFLCTLPFWATDSSQNWVFGQAICKSVSALYKINFFACMLLLTCISIDRYVAIVRVTEAYNQTRRARLQTSKMACCAVWLASCILALPEFIFAQVKDDSCKLVYWQNTNNQTKVLVLSLQICIGFCVPLLVMACCYSVIIRNLLQARSFEKHKALRVIFAVVAVFILSQLPYSVHLVLEAVQANNHTMTDCEQLQSFDITGQVVKSLAYTHCCLNPFLYVFIGVRFRNDLLKALHRITCRPTPATSKRPSVLSDTDTTPAFSF
ncbi:C-C chemokine receptor type 9 [Denticeps clupeoides]|uniref:G-protein coupled receptors family 1 profile domain-containing protein n=1 Tax=Denticeps clupeoides TaxID=299321 RepID=A0AAY4B0C0_9TELE|nr:C-C chemokine receptor type 9-like [Denticeps clupeoides]